MLMKFKELYIDGIVTQDDNKEKFHEECRKLLESGYKFRYILMCSFICELSLARKFSKKSLQNAKKAFDCLLPYGVNLCRFPGQKEYTLIKVVHSYFCHCISNIPCCRYIKSQLLKMKHTSPPYYNNIFLNDSNVM